MFELPSKDGNITPEKACNSWQMQFCDKTAYVWGFRYRWAPLAGSRTLCHPGVNYWWLTSFMTHCKPHCKKKVPSPQCLFCIERLPRMRRSLPLNTFDMGRHCSSKLGLTFPRIWGSYFCALYFCVFVIALNSEQLLYGPHQKGFSKICSCLQLLFSSFLKDSPTAFFYRTRVRSLVMLVSDSLTDWVTPV